MDYHWRKYDGVIPPDAVSAGVDTDGTPVYVGQVGASFNNNYGLIPGAIRITSAYTYVTLGNGDYYGSNVNVQILCSQFPSRIQWYPANDADFSTIANRTSLVVSGFEFDQSSTGYPLYIGRSQKGIHRVVGKIRNVNVGNHIQGRLYYIHSQTEYFASNYEVLAFF
nr:uncharacterized protein LOC111516266 [Leptinotarsa decemlineata]